jgi:polyferredoxin
MNNILSRVRRWVAAVVLLAAFLAITGLLDTVPFTDIDMSRFLRLQLIPAIMAGGVLTIVFIVVGSLLFGRIYCSVLCPLGILQDVSDRLFRLRRRKKTDKKKGGLYTKKRKASHRKANPLLRFGFLGISVLVFILGSSIVLLLLDPYSIFGRFTTTFVNPVVSLLNNGLARIFNYFGSYIFVNGEVHLTSVSLAIVTAVTIAIILFLVRSSGRLWCNTVCPVGTALGEVSRWSVMRVQLNEEKCIACNACIKTCKAQCIDNEYKIDYSRCVTCFNCIETCPTGALSYGLVKGRKK